MIKRLSVIIVSYNSGDFIEKCIKSVLKNLPENSEIIVLDNASNDETVDILKKFGKKIKLIISNKNLGFGMGSNLASKKASGEYLFLLNPDTEIIKPIFDELINFYEKTPDAGIVAPKLVMQDEKIQPSVKKLPTVWGAFKEYILGEKYAYGEYAPENSEPVEVEMAYGAAWLVKKDLFNKLNGFDEKFFLYYEDADFCKRIRKWGKKVYYYPKVSIKHLVGGTKSKADKYMLNLESAKKYHGILKFIILQLIFKINSLLKKTGILR